MGNRTRVYKDNRDKVLVIVVTVVIFDLNDKKKKKKLNGICIKRKVSKFVKYQLLNKY